VLPRRTPEVVGGCHDSPEEECAAWGSCCLDCARAGAAVGAAGDRRGREGGLGVSACCSRPAARGSAGGGAAAVAADWARAAAAAGGWVRQG